MEMQCQRCVAAGLQPAHLSVPTSLSVCAAQLFAPLTQCHSVAVGLLCVCPWASCHTLTHTHSLTHRCSTLSVVDYSLITQWAMTCTLCAPPASAQPRPRPLVPPATGTYCNHHSLWHRRIGCTLETSVPAPPFPCPLPQVRLSVVEIYCERIRDLLDPSRDNLQVKQDSGGAIFIEGA